MIIMHRTKTYVIEYTAYWRWSPSWCLHQHQQSNHHSSFSISNCLSYQYRQHLLYFNLVRWVNINMFSNFITYCKLDIVSYVTIKDERKQQYKYSIHNLATQIVSTGSIYLAKQFSPCCFVHLHPLLYWWCTAPESLRTHLHMIEEEWFVSDNWFRSNNTAYVSVSLLTMAAVV